MALSTKTITTKIRSVKNIGKITRAMELVAAAKMKPAIDRSVASREYAARALEIIRNLSKHAELRHPLMREHADADATLAIVIAADKGLCGSYNAAIAKAFTTFAAQQSGTVSLVAVGKYAEQLSRLEGVALHSTFGAADGEPRWTDARDIAEQIIDAYRTSSYRRIVVLYTRYYGALSYTPVAEVLLPIHLDSVAAFQETVGNMAKTYAEHPTERMEAYLFEPSEEELLDAALPRLVASQVYQAMLEARASEHSARMFAMKNASDNAKNVVDDLTLSFNQARQGAITNELSEIVAGAEAL